MFGFVHSLFSFGGGISGAIAAALFSGLQHWLSSAAQWFVDQVLSSTTAITPQAGNHWFATVHLKLYPLDLVVVVPLLFVATIGAVLRQDMHRLGRVWAVGLPLALVGGYAVEQLAFIGVNVTDALSQLIEAEVEPHIGRVFGDVVAASFVPGMPGAAAVFVSILLILGSLAIWLELVLRSASVEVALFFMPLAFAGLVWPSTAHWAKRLLQVVAALLLAKPVVMGALCLGANAFTSSKAGLSSAVTGAAILLMAAFAPMAVLKLVPIAEASAIAHLQGTARQPLASLERSVQRAMAAVGSMGSLRGAAASDSEGGPVVDRLMADVGAGRQADDLDDGGLGPARYPAGAGPHEAGPHGAGR